METGRTQDRSSSHYIHDTEMNLIYYTLSKCRRFCQFVALLFMRFLCPGAAVELRVLTSAGTARWEKRTESEMEGKTV